MSAIKLYIVTNNIPVILEKQLKIEKPPSWMVVTDDIDEILNIPDGATAVSYMVGRRLPKSPQELALAERKQQVSIAGLDMDQYQYLRDLETGKRSLAVQPKSENQHTKREVKEMRIA